MLQRYLQGDDEEHRQLFDLLERMLEYDPEHRIKLPEVMRHPFFDKLTPEQKCLQANNGDVRERSHSLSR